MLSHAWKVCILDLRLKINIRQYRLWLIINQLIIPALVWSNYHHYYLYSVYDNALLLQTLWIMIISFCLWFSWYRYICQSLHKFLLWTWPYEIENINNIWSDLSKWDNEIWVKIDSYRLLRQSLFSYIYSFTNIFYPLLPSERFGDISGCALLATAK